MDIENARLNMLKQQLRTNGVLNKQILHLFDDIHREEFVPSEYRHLAYADTTIPLGHDQIMLTPMNQAQILQALTITPEDKVLEVGTGLGFFTALLAQCAKHVHSIDIFPDFIEQAKKNLASQECSNVTLECQDGSESYPTHAPYDVILITSAVPELPDIFLEHLHIEGRLFTFIGSGHAMKATLITRNSTEQYHYETLFEAEVPMMIRTIQTETFHF